MWPVCGPATVPLWLTLSMRTSARSGDTSVRGPTIVDRCWWVWNLVSGSVNAYGVLLEAIENLRTSAGPEDHRVRAVTTGAETDALVPGSCHQPCFPQLHIINLPHWPKEPPHASAAQADPPVEELQPDSAGARIERARQHATDECRCPPGTRKPAPARVSHSPPPPFSFSGVVIAECHDDVCMTMARRPECES
jgi:hypothetical protein